MEYVTRNGRSKGPGRGTRASLSVRRRGRGQDRPLPFALQCHPPKLARTPRHPGCGTFLPWGGPMARYAKLAQADSTVFQRGAFLSGEGEWALYVQSPHFKYGPFRHHDANEALGWKRAAERLGYSVCLMQEGAL